MVANRLARHLSTEIAAKEVQINMISDTESHIYQPGLLYVALGLAEPDSLFRKHERLLLPGVNLIHDPAVKIDMDSRSIKLNSGKSMEFDYLVLATGSHPDFDDIPGFREAAHTFYTYEEAMRTRRDLEEFKQGKLLMIIGVPHKCPVAPLEFMFMYDKLLRQRQERDNIELVYTYPLGRLHSLEPVAEWSEGAFETAGIAGETFFNPEEIDPKNKVVSTLEGDEVSYDFLAAIPPHKGAAVIRASGLGDPDGWLPTNKYTLQLEGHEGAYVVGDAAALPISKAGSTAHYESEVVVRNIVREIHGEKPMPLYDGKVYCFIEGGLQEATHITFDYNNPPKPSEPTEMVHWFKMAFNRMYWLSVRGLV
ncbi:NAD(P)/FAD-dependent oxidoreductase [Alicyclobacillus sp. SO9]|nr:NAD(P)/FAD-dependent oxidoreductase [Alicyclobacillus sp. SO9]